METKAIKPEKQNLTDLSVGEVHIIAGLVCLVTAGVYPGFALLN